MAHKTGMMGNQRDFGMRGGPGKGSKSRITDTKKFNENFDNINWGGKPKKKKQAEKVYCSPAQDNLL